MEKTKFNRMVGKLIATDVPTLIALQQSEIIGSFSFNFEQMECKTGEKLFVRFFAHGYNDCRVVYTSVLMDNQKGVRYNDFKEYRKFIQNLQK